MTGTVDARLAALGIALPAAAAPAANYVPYRIDRGLVYISGQLPMADGKIAYTGKVGADVDLAHAVAAARQCFINILAQAKAAAGGDLDKVAQLIKLGGFVNCIDGYPDQPKIINGASDLAVEVLGEAGKHARFAVGTNALPFDATVEIDAVVRLKD